MEKLTASASGLNNILTISVSDSHVSPTSTAVVSCLSCNKDIGDSLTITMGYEGDTFTALNGYIKNVEFKEPELVYSVTVSNVLIRAVDYFIAAENPDEPFSRQNISAEGLVQDILALAGLTDFASDSSSFTFAINNPVEVNLTSAYDYCRFIGDIIAFNLYANASGQVNFRNRRPYPMGSDDSVYTITTSKLLNGAYTVSDKDLRNRVVVYGSEDIRAEASESSPYLPDGFYKTAVVAAPGVIDSQSMADQSAEYNLDLLNRLTKRLSLSIIGKTGLRARQCVTVNIPSLVDGPDLWYIYAIEHNWSSAGYVTNLELRLQ